MPNRGGRKKAGWRRGSRWRCRWPGRCSSSPERPCTTRNCVSHHSPSDTSAMVYWRFFRVHSGFFGVLFGFIRDFLGFYLGSFGIFWGFIWVHSGFFRIFFGVFGLIGFFGMFGIFWGFYVGCWVIKFLLIFEVFWGFIGGFWVVWWFLGCV